MSKVIHLIPITEDRNIAIYAIDIVKLLITYRNLGANYEFKLLNKDVPITIDTDGNVNVLNPIGTPLFNFNMRSLNPYYGMYNTLIEQGYLKSPDNETSN